MKEIVFGELTLGYSSDYPEKSPSLKDLQEISGWALLEFGTAWCAHCQKVQPWLVEALGVYSHLPHVKVLDGKGKKLGRQFKVTLWPTMILLKYGEEKGRLERAGSLKDIQSLLALIPTHDLPS